MEKPTTMEELRMYFEIIWERPVSNEEVIGQIEGGESWIKSVCYAIENFSEGVFTREKFLSRADVFSLSMTSIPVEAILEQDDVLRNLQKEIWKIRDSENYKPDLTKHSNGLIESVFITFPKED
jgi:hypothetical protein